MNESSVSTCLLDLFQDNPNPLSKELSEKLVVLKERLEGTPYIANEDDYSDEQLLGRLKAYGLEIDRDLLQQKFPNTVSIDEIYDELLSQSNLAGSGGLESDWFFFSVNALWKRWFPDRLCISHVEEKIDHGYFKYYEEKSFNEACQLWFEAWNDFKGVLRRAKIKSIPAFEIQFEGYGQTICEFLQVLLQDLMLIGRKNNDLMRRGITICEEALAILPLFGYESHAGFDLFESTVRLLESAKEESIVLLAEADC